MHTETGADEDRECILCGRCLEVCPLFAATGQEELSPRGKAFVLAKVLEQGALGSPEAARKLLGLCLGCGRCVRACPQQRDFPRALRRLKAEHPGWQSWVWRAWITQAPRIWTRAAMAARLLPQRSSPGSLAAGLQVLAERPRISALLRYAPGAHRQKDSTLLFPGCVARWARPWWGQTAGTLLGARAVGGPDWNCCGFTLGQAGLVREQLDACRANIAVWRAFGRPKVATICSTCHSALQGYAGEAGLFEDADESLMWSRAVCPLSTLLDPAKFESIKRSSVFYHRPCHAPGADREIDPDQKLLRSMLGSDLSAADPGACCGLGGVMRLSAPALSVRIGQLYWKNMPDPEISRVVTGCSGCVLQLAASAPEGVTAAHWLDLIACG